MRTPPERLNFTKAALNSLAWPTPPAERRYVYDTGLAGLAVAVFASGSKVFYAIKKIDGRPERIKLGTWPLMTVEQARTSAAEKLGAIAGGMNPNDAVRGKRAAPTFGEMFQMFLLLPTRTKVVRDKAPKTVKEYRLQNAAYLAAWQNRKLTTISHADVAKLHNQLSEKRVEKVKVIVNGKEVAKDKIVGGPYIANRVLALVKAVFNAAIHAKQVTVNPAVGIMPRGEDTRERFLYADELPKFWAAIDAEPSEKIRDYIRTLLFTGQRRGNVASMKWEDVNLERAIWTMPTTKTGKHQVPLSAEAVAILKRRQASAEDEYVFPGHSKGTHLKDPMRAWRSILERAGIKDLRIHDLRRSLGSWQTKTGASLSIVGKTLGHRQPSTTAIYARLDLDPVRASVETATAAIMAAAQPPAAKPKRGKRTA